MKFTKIGMKFTKITNFTKLTIISQKKGLWVKNLNRPLLKSVFGNQKCVLKNIKNALFLFSAPCSFFSLRETLQLTLKRITSTFAFNHSGY